MGRGEVLKRGVLTGSGKNGDDLSQMCVVNDFVKLADARECALVLAAKGIPYAIQREGDAWILKVEANCLDRAVAEVTEYEGESKSQKGGDFCGGEGSDQGSVRYWSLSAVALSFVLFGILQAEGGEGWRDAGLFISTRILQGEWWRALTALTLHGDLPHLLANLASCLLFGGMLIPRFGQGVGWWMVLFSGFVGNLSHAWFYGGMEHRSLGASTGVFGALGLLTGGALIQAFGDGVRPSWWRWVLPLGAGFGLLATFGGGGHGQVPRVDVLAHLSGFGTGVIFGAVFERFSLSVRSARIVQIACGGLSIVALSVAWYFAYRGSRLGAPL